MRARKTPVFSTGPEANLIFFAKIRRSLLKTAKNRAYYTAEFLLRSMAYGLLGSYVMALTGLRNSALLFGTSAFFLFLSLTYRAIGYEDIEVKNGGRIHGRVRLDGEAPRLLPLGVTKYKDVCKNVPDETLVVGPQKGIRYAVVTLEGITRGKPVERETIHELDNANCRFVPHVQALSVGQFLLLKNTDPILHTAHAYFPDGQPHFNVGLYPGRVARKPLVSPGIVKIVCEVHPWMTAYLMVTEHPYHSVTDLYGEYLIGDVPAGIYRLKVWHEKLGTVEKQIDVKQGKTLEVDFTYPPVKEESK